jgi:hypothetical protein
MAKRKAKNTRARSRRPEGKRVPRKAPAIGKSLKRRKPVPRRSTILIRQWPIHWPIPADAVPGSAAVYYIERVSHVRIGRRVYRRLRGYSQWFLIPDRAPRWVTAPEFQAGLENEVTFAGHELTTFEMKVYHSHPDGDFVNLDTRFVWTRPLHPINIKGKGILPPFNLIRIWFFVRKSSDHAPEGMESYEYQLWCRTARPPEPVAFSDLHAEAVRLFKKVRHDVPRLKGGSAVGFRVSGPMIAWTGYIGHLPSFGKRKKK